MRTQQLWAGGLGLAMAVGLAGMNGASACERSYAPVQYQTVTVWEPQVEAYSTWVTKCDHCGRAYRVEVIRYRTRSVAVTRRIRVS